jgi:hypothetical protein
MMGEGRYGMKSGQGCFAWDEKSIAAEKARYETALQDVLDSLKKTASDS